MKYKLQFCSIAVIAAIAGLTSCTNSSSSPENASVEASADTPTFSLAWSEYPSWSVFGVADELGLIDGAKGKLGSVEKKHGVDIELKEAGYDSCLNMFGSKECDAVCITNMDALIVSPSREGVAVLPTSTSKGADACLVTDKIADIEALKQHKVYGLQGTVSQYCFARCLEKEGMNEADFQFTNQDPGAAAAAMKTNAESHQAIMVWNPFVLQTQRDRSDVRVLFDSSQIEGEIVDMVVVGKDKMSETGADKFVAAVAEAFYEVGKSIDGTERGNEILVALGKKFSNLGLEDMNQVLEQTVFYRTPADAKALFASDTFKANMRTVTDFCTSHDGLIKSEDVSIGYGADAGAVKLQFDASLLP